VSGGGVSESASRSRLCLRIESTCRRSGRRRRRRAMLRISKVSRLATRLTGMLGGNLYELLPMGRGGQSYRLQASRDLAGSTARDFRISARMVRGHRPGCWGLLARGTLARQNRLMATEFERVIR